MISYFNLWSRLTVALLFGSMVLGGPLSARAQSGALSANDSRRIDGVVAIVEGEPIYQSEVEEQLYLFLIQSRARPDSSEQSSMRKEILNRLIDEKLIILEAKRRQVTVEDAEIESQVDAAIADAKIRLGGESAYIAELTREGITESDLRQRYRTEIRRQALANQLLRRQLSLNLEVGMEEAKRYFQNNKSEFPMRPPELRLGLIQIPITPDSLARIEARKRAAKALSRVEKGESFARVAQEVSQDPNTKNSGGDLGFFARGQLDSTFERVAFALQPGEVSEIIETPFGFHIIRMEEVDPGKDEVHARHILIRLPVTAKDQERAFELAESVYKRAVQGEDYASLVKLFSKFRGPQGDGGDLGFLPITDFSPEIRAVVETLEIGKISPPQPSPQGYVVFKVLERRSEREYELEEIEDQLPELVRQIKLREEYDGW